MTISANQTPAKMGVRARERSSLERITDLEFKVESFLNATRQSFANNDQNVGELVEVVSAVVRLLGAEQVAQTLLDIQKEKLVEKAGEEKAQLQAAVEAGHIAPGILVVPESIIEGVERNEDGTEVAPGYVQLAFANLKEEYQSKLVARGVGDKFETENGRQFEITGIYEPVVGQKAE
jgi:hypothetical protein